MNIREYSSDDRSQIMSLMTEFGAYLESLDPLQRTDFKDGAEAYFTDRFIKEAQDRKGKVFVAEEDDMIVGFIGGYIDEQSEEDLMEQKKATPGVVSEFFVTKEYRKSGIGTELLNKIEEHLKAQGSTLIRLDVFAPNEIGRNFYKKHGYQDRSVVVSKDI